MSRRLVSVGLAVALAALSGCARPPAPVDEAHKSYIGNWVSTEKELFGVHADGQVSYPVPLPGDKMPPMFLKGAISFDTDNKALYIGDWPFRKKFIINKPPHRGGNVMYMQLNYISYKRQLTPEEIVAAHREIQEDHKNGAARDLARVNALNRIKNAVEGYYQRYRQVPPNKSTVYSMVGELRDPKSGLPYGYKSVGNQAFQICAIFETNQNYDHKGKVDPNGIELHGVGTECIRYSWR